MDFLHDLHIFISTCTFISSSRFRTELITHGYCIENYRKTNPNCDHEFQYNYPLVFLKIARFQIGGSICRPLIKFRKCMIDPLMNQCDQRAITIWNQTLTTVERGFCYRQQYINGCRSPTHHLLIVTLSLVLLTFQVSKAHSVI